VHSAELYLFGCLEADARTITDYYLIPSGAVSELPGAFKSRNRQDVDKDKVGNLAAVAKATGRPLGGASDEARFFAARHSALRSEIAVAADISQRCTEELDHNAFEAAGTKRTGPKEAG
jgi:hypothetical protein